MCGLYGIINNGPKPFRRDIFTVLGIMNDRRGGDSCGVYIDDKVEYGIGQQALFENFFWDCDLLNNTETCEVALGHDRKASVGGITVEKAHPILIKNDEGKTDFVLVHNGTIHNYEKLAKEYIPGIDCTGLSDSQVLALILYHSGFTVLSKYNGGTAFVAVDYRKGYPETFLFKGASKTTSAATETSVERPLYFSYNQEGLIFSSIASVLCALTDNNVYEAKDNKVYKYVHGKLYTVQNIDRSFCQQNKEYDYSAYRNYNPAYNGYNASDFKYIKYNDLSNLYTNEDKKLLHGKFHITTYGRIVDKSNKKDKLFTVYFFQGIPYNNKYTFNIVNKLYKKSKCSFEEFVKKNIITLRYYSSSNIFFDGTKAFSAVSETGFVPYTGNLLVLGSARILKFTYGTLISTVYGSDYEAAFKSGGYV